MKQTEPESECARPRAQQRPNIVALAILPRDLRSSLGAAPGTGALRSAPCSIVGTLLLAVVVLLPRMACAFDEVAIRAALEAHDRAVYIHEHWIRDPYILHAPDGWYYLTGTTLESEEDKVIGIPAWRSRDLAAWEPLPRLWQYSESTWMQELKPGSRVDNKKLLVWAPEVHFIDGRWVIVHTSNAGAANLLINTAPELQAPFTEPIGAGFGRRHDPSIFTDDDGTHWLVYACAKLIPLKPDFSGFAGPEVEIGPSNRKMGHEGCVIRKIGSKYVLFGTAWSTDTLRHGTYNLYYCTADKVTGPYGPRKFAGRFLGHGTPFLDKQGRWWCTAFYNANKPTLTDEDLVTRDLSDTAYTLNRQGTTLVPLDVQVVDGDVVVHAKDLRYAKPGAEEVQKF